MFCVPMSEGSNLPDRIACGGYVHGGFVLNGVVVRHWAKKCCVHVCVVFLFPLVVGAGVVIVANGNSINNMTTSFVGPSSHYENPAAQYSQDNIDSFIIFF